MILPNLRLALAGLIIPLGCGFQFYHYVVINPSQEMFKEFLNESYLINYGREMGPGTYNLIWTFQISLLIFGAVCSALVAPYMCEKFGRRGTLQLINIPVVVGTVLMCVAIKVYSIELLAVGRFVIGLNFGLAPAATGLFLNEISPKEIRGFMGSSQELSLSIAALIGMTVGIPELLGTREYVYLLLCLPLFPVAVAAVFLWRVPETPKHLLLTKMDEEAADRSLMYYYGPEADFEEVKKTFWREKQLSTGQSVGLRECFRNRKIRRGFLLGIVATLATRLTGISAVFFFSTQIFNEAGMSLRHANYSTVLMSLVNTIASAVMPPLLIERFGRRPLMLLSLCGCLSCHVFFVLFSELYVNYGLQWTCYPAVAALIVHVVFYACGAGPISWFLVNELVPQAARSKAQATVTLFRRITGFIDGLIFYPLYGVIGPYALLVCSVGPSSLCVAILVMFLPETRNKDIDVLFEEYESIWMSDRSSVG